MTMVTITGKPVPFARPGVGRGGKRYTPREYGDWKNMAVQFMRIVHSVKPIEGPVAALVGVATDKLLVQLIPVDELWYEWEQYHPYRRPARPKGVRGDLDNYVKAALDAAQDAGWIEDDRQVVAVVAYFVEVEEFQELDQGEMENPLR